MQKLNFLIFLIIPFFCLSDQATLDKETVKTIEKYAVVGAAMTFSTFGAWSCLEIAKKHSVSTFLGENTLLAAVSNVLFFLSIPGNPGPVLGQILLGNPGVYLGAALPGLAAGAVCGAICSHLKHRKIGNKKRHCKEKDSS